MRERLGAMGVPCPRWAPVADAAGAARRSATRSAGRVVLKADDRRLRRQGRVDGRPASTPPPRCWRSGTRLIAEERVPIVRELAAVVARSPFGQGAVVAGGRDGAARRHLRRGARARARPRRRAGRGRRRPWRCASPPSWASPASSRSSCSRPRTAWSSTSWPCARTTRRTGRSRARGPRSSSSTCAPCSTTRSARPTWPRRSSSWPTCSAAPDDVVPKGIDERVHHCMAHWPDVKIHLYGKQFRPGRKVGHVTALGDDLDAVRARAARPPRDYLMNGDADDAMSGRSAGRRDHGQRLGLLGHGRRGRRAGRVRRRPRGPGRVGAPHPARHGRLRPGRRPAAA